MPAGLQVWDEEGNLVLDTNTRLSRVIGSVFVTDNGSIGGISGFNQGTPFVYVMSTTGEFVNLPWPTISGTTLSWTYPGSGPFPSGKNPAVIFYGVY